MTAEVRTIRWRNLFIRFSLVGEHLGGRRGDHGPAALSDYGNAKCWPEALSRPGSRGH